MLSHVPAHLVPTTAHSAAVAVDLSGRLCVRQYLTLTYERITVSAAGGEVLRDLRAPAAEEEQRFEAAGVAQAARARGGGSSGVLDALEAAEAAQEEADGRRGDPPQPTDAVPTT